MGNQGPYTEEHRQEELEDTKGYAGVVHRRKTYKKSLKIQKEESGRYSEEGQTIRV